MKKVVKDSISRINNIYRNPEKMKDINLSDNAFVERMVKDYLVLGVPKDFLVNRDPVQYRWRFAASTMYKKVTRIEKEIGTLISESKAGGGIKYKELPLIEPIDTFKLMEIYVSYTNEYFIDSMFKDAITKSDYILMMSKYLTKKVRDSKIKFKNNLTDKEILFYFSQICSKEYKDQYRIIKTFKNYTKHKENTSFYEKKPQLRIEMIDSLDNRYMDFILDKQKFIDDLNNHMICLYNGLLNYENSNSVDIKIEEFIEDYQVSMIERIISITEEKVETIKNRDENSIQKCFKRKYENSDSLINSLDNLLSKYKKLKEII